MHNYGFMLFLDDLCKESFLICFYLFLTAHLFIRLEVYRRLISAIKVGFCEFMILNLDGSKDINGKNALIAVF